MKRILSGTKGHLKNYKQPLVAGFVAVLAGTILTMVSGAMTFVASSEAESGTLSRSDMLVSSMSASDGKAVRFDNTTVSPTDGLGITTPSIISQFQTGTTHTQYSNDNYNDSASVVRAKHLLADSAVLQNQHIMGWGADNPEPSPGQYDWGSLDNRINTTMDSAGEKTITLCCAPDWMKGGQAGTTDWSKLETAPLPEHYDDFADLAATVAQRYPSVKYFQVWNEMKGFFLNDSNNRWNYESYTTLYNKVWAKVKAVRPDAKLGGPYIVMDAYGGSQSNPSQVSGPWGQLDQRPLDVIQYWLKNKTGADFITVDGGTDMKDGVNPVDDFARIAVFKAVSDWIRSLSPSQYPGSSTLPLWWAEWYPRTDSSSDSIAKKSAVMAAGYVTTIASGAQTALVWGAQGDTNGLGDPLAIFTDTRVAGGGQPTPLYTTTKIIKQYFSAGTQLYNTNNTNANIAVLASHDKMLVINQTASNQAVRVYGTDTSLAPYEVHLFDIP